MRTRELFVVILFVGLSGLLGGGVNSGLALGTHECAFCHDFHGAPAFSLLKYSSTEVLCLSCHSVMINDTKAAAVHNPGDLASNEQGYITCRECHNPHQGNMGSNIKLVGYKYDPQNNRSFSTPTIRVELPTSNPAFPVYKPVTFESMTAPTADYYRHDGKGACEICHTSNHLIGADCAACHEHNKDFAPLPPEGFPATGSCTNCHTGTGTDANGLYSYDAYKVGPGSQHTKLKATDSSSAACTACHAGHSTAPTVVIPNNPSVGINYTANGETGIALGGTATSGSTEAEICWNCHDQDGNGSLNDSGDISEWKGFAYNGYTVTGSKSWATANFDAPGSRIPNRATVSIHSANDIDTDATITKVRASSVAYNVDGSGRTSNHASFSGSKTLEDVKYIRCSYCHDVHDTYGPDKGDTHAFGGTAGTLSIAPTYLRGSWVENPYYARTTTSGLTSAEIPPEATRHSATHFTTNNHRTGNWGTTNTQTVPRLIANSTGSEKEGGYFIDQNSRWPTRTGSATYMSVADSAGLCVACHGSNIDTMDYYTGSSLWRNALPKNGHANSTLGGSGRGATTYASDIFDAALRDGTSPGLTRVTGYMAGQGLDDNVDGSKWGENRRPLPWDVKSKYSNPEKPDNNNNGIPVPNSGWYNWTAAGNPRITTDVGSAHLRGGDYTTWYGGSTNSGIGGDGRDNIRAHNFTCSKCHTPHASGLPALLITNCLDFGIANYVVTAPLNDADRTTRLGPGSGYATATNQEQRLSWQVMNNCHRKSSNSTGWNKLAPLQ